MSTFSDDIIRVTREHKDTRIAVDYGNEAQVSINSTILTDEQVAVLRATIANGIVLESRVGPQLQLVKIHRLLNAIRP